MVAQQIKHRLCLLAYRKQRVSVASAGIIVRKEGYASITGQRSEQVERLYFYNLRFDVKYTLIFKYIFTPKGIKGT